MLRETCAECRLRSSRQSIGAGIERLRRKSGRTIRESPAADCGNRAAAGALHKQAIAIGLSEARRSGVKLGTPKRGSSSLRRKTSRDTAVGQGRAKPSATRSRGARKAAKTRERRYHR